jgi:pyrroloquinoline quinone biosynthesis protein D
MSDSPLEMKPRLAPGCRLGTGPGQEELLLIPECALKLKGTSRAVVELCDGARTVREIVAELAARYSADSALVETDVVALLGKLHDRGVMEYA